MRLETHWEALLGRARLAIEYAEDTIEWAQQALELSTGEIGQVVGATRRTVQRWREGRSAPSPRHRKHLEAINQLRYLLETGFRNADAAERWMHSPLPALKGRTPLFTITEGELDLVITILAGLASGAHA